MTYNLKQIPNHIAIIMDGNGRWAKLKGLPKIEGHRAGAAAVEGAIRGCMELGVKILSLYAFSTENWRRPKKEVEALMWLLEQYLKKKLLELKKNNIRLIVSGEMAMLPSSIQRQVKNVINQTKSNCRLILNLAISYGGRQDILQATKAIAAKIEDKQLALDDISEKLFSRHLYTKDLPDPELLIRTSGEQRVSNFFLWQISYSELYFSSKFWPDFCKQDLLDAVLDYQRRERRFGG